MIPTLSGTIDFNLSAMPLPVNDASSCSLDQISDGVTEVETDDLFKRKRMKGWWPVYEVDDEGMRLLNVSTSIHSFIIVTVNAVGGGKGQRLWCL